jgi:hypothetical protein
MTNETRPICVVAGVERPMNDDEYAQYLKDLDTFAKVKEAEAKARADKAALLARLGITAEEAALLLGGTN